MDGQLVHWLPLLGAFALAALLLWMRDRSRDRRGVPQWKRKRSELKVRRAGAVINLFVYGGFCIALVVRGAPINSRPLGISVMLLGGLGLLWSVQTFVRTSRRFSERIEQLRPTENAPLEKKG
jgi:hypothetical protein